MALLRDVPQESASLQLRTFELPVLLDDLQVGVAVLDADGIVLWPGIPRRRAPPEVRAVAPLGRIQRRSVKLVMLYELESLSRRQVRCRIL